MAIARDFGEASRDLRAQRTSRIPFKHPHVRLDQLGPTADPRCLSIDDDGMVDLGGFSSMCFFDVSKQMDPS